MMDLSPIVSRASDSLLLAGLVAAPAVAGVEALKRRAKRLDGWWTVLAAFVACMVVSVGFIHPAGWSDVWEVASVSVLAWIIAVGGDSVATRLIDRAKAPRSEPKQ